MRMKIEADKLTYRGLSNGPLGGWNYTVKSLGFFMLGGWYGADEVERLVRQEYPKANRFRIYYENQRGTMELGFSGTI